MPTSGIHLIVAKNIANHHKELDNYSFYLGSIAPDAVNVNGFAPKEYRWMAHLRDKDLNVWKDNITKFYSKEKNQYNSCFLKGYITHIMTDIIYDELFYMDIAKKIEKSGVDSKEVHSFMLKEMAYFSSMHQDFIYTKNILRNNNLSYDIRNIKKEMLLLWKDKIINEIISNKNSSFITDNLIIDLSTIVEKELVIRKVI